MPDLFQLSIASDGTDSRIACRINNVDVNLNDPAVAVKACRLLIACSSTVKQVVTDEDVAAVARELAPTYWKPKS